MLTFRDWNVCKFLHTLPHRILLARYRAIKRNYYPNDESFRHIMKVYKQEVVARHKVRF